MTFTNWLTADPLSHPQEPLAQEELVSVDATHVHATSAWPGGFFASYHAYPYYPDFLGLQPNLARAHSPYAAYLRLLRRHHRGQAVMITEFGVPTGLGAAHRGPLGRDQGDHSEQQAAAMDAQMMREIKRAGYAGADLFEWTDEWFKLTWNTQDLAQPVARRPLWRNVLTNEEQFGVVAVEPGKRPLVTVDGRTKDWAHATTLLRGPITVQAQHDAAYLYLLVHRPNASAPVQIGLDTRPGGDGGLPGRPGVDPQADMALTLGPGRSAHLQQAEWTDPIEILYGLNHGYVPYRAADLRQNSNAWVDPRLILDRPYTVRGTGQARPTELIDLGHLRWGTADPNAPGDDERVLAAGDGRTVELRLPWMLLGYADPSSNRVYVVHDSGAVTTQKVGPIGVAVAPAGRPAVAARSYGWAGWNSVQWHERRKAGWGTLQRAFATASR
jgi:hypothetical protein